MLKYREDLEKVVTKEEIGVSPTFCTKVTLR